MMTEEELQEITAINAARTPGKWRLFTGIKGLVEVQIAGVRAPIVGWPGFDDSDRSSKEHRRNAAFIARSSTAVPDMLAEVKRLNKYVELLKSDRAQSDRLQAQISRLRAVLEAIHTMVQRPHYFRDFEAIDDIVREAMKGDKP